MSENTTPEEVTNFVLDYYLKRHKIVLQKFEIARDATEESIEDKGSEDASSKKQKYRGAWDNIISIFGNAYLTHDELDQIESVLLKSPEDIKRRMDELIMLNEQLQSLMSSLDKEAFEQAMQEIEEKQEEVNPLSGLSRQDYTDETEEFQEDVAAFKIMPQTRNRDD